jgi:hypothetical protein
VHEKELRYIFCKISLQETQVNKKCSISPTKVLIDKTKKKCRKTFKAESATPSIKLAELGSKEKSSLTLKH